MYPLSRAVKEDGRKVTKNLTEETEGQEMLQILLNDLPQFSSEGEALHLEKIENRE